MREARTFSISLINGSMIRQINRGDVTQRDDESREQRTVAHLRHLARYRLASSHLKISRGLKNNFRYPYS